MSSFTSHYTDDDQSALNKFFTAFAGEDETDARNAGVAALVNDIVQQAKNDFSHVSALNYCNKPWILPMRAFYSRIRLFLLRVC